MDQLLGQLEQSHLWEEAAPPADIALVHSCVYSSQPVIYLECCLTADIGGIAQSNINFHLLLSKFFLISNYEPVL